MSWNETKDDFRDIGQVVLRTGRVLSKFVMALAPVSPFPIFLGICGAVYISNKQHLDEAARVATELLGPKTFSGGKAPAVMVWEVLATSNFSMMIVCLMVAFTNIRSTWMAIRGSRFDRCQIIYSMVALTGFCLVEAIIANAHLAGDLGPTDLSEKIQYHYGLSIRTTVDIANALWALTLLISAQAFGAISYFPEDFHSFPKEKRFKIVGKRVVLARRQMYFLAASLVLGALSSQAYFRLLSPVAEEASKRFDTIFWFLVPLKPKSSNAIDALAFQLSGLFAAGCTFVSGSMYLTTIWLLRRRVPDDAEFGDDVRSVKERKEYLVGYGIVDEGFNRKVGRSALALSPLIASLISPSLLRLLVKVVELMEK